MTNKWTELTNAERNELSLPIGRSVVVGGWDCTIAGVRKMAGVAGYDVYRQGSTRKWGPVRPDAS